MQKQLSLMSCFGRSEKSFVEEPKAKKPGRPPKEAKEEPVEKKRVGRPRKVKQEAEAEPECKVEEVKEEADEEGGQQAAEEPAEDQKYMTPTKKPKFEKLGSWEKPDRSPEESPEDYAKRCGQLAGMLGKEAGMMGGRPSAQHTRGVASGLTHSNRKPIGAVSLKKERDPSVFLSMCEYIEKAEQKAASPEALEKHLMSLYPYSVQELEEIRRNKDHWEHEVKMRKLGRRANNNHLRLGEQEYSGDFVIHTGVGMRAAGGGVKLVLKELFLKTAIWFELERSSGSFVDKTDLFLEWLFHAKKLETRLKGKAEAFEIGQDGAEPLSVLEQEQMKRLSTRFASFEKHPKNRLDFQTELAQRLGAKLLKPQRLCNLTTEEEAHRFKCTIQCQDEAMWILAFGEDNELSLHFSDPEFVKNNRENAVLLFSDQVPWWVKVKSCRQLYTAKETRTTGQVEKGLQTFNLNHKSNQDTQTAAGLTLAEVDEAPGDEGMTQKRGQSDGSNDKYRITLVLLQIVWNWFSEDLDPVGQWGPSVLILIGAYGQLSNINDQHEFVEDKIFVVGGKEIFHQKGTKTLIMYKWVELRKRATEENDERLLLYFAQFADIMQQPSGFEDAIISKWIIELQGKAYPVSIHQRDMFLGCLTRSSKMAMWLIQQMDTWVAAKMTPNQQITDTDAVFPLKGNAKGAEDDIRREMKSIADSTGQRPNWTCGPYEILRISAEAIIRTKPDFDAGGILAAGVRNGQLSLRPDFKQKRLVRTDEQDWCKNLRTKKGEPVKLGSHRIKSSWIEKRYEWLDKTGRPQPPQWTTKATQGFDSMQDQTYVEEEGTTIKQASFEQPFECVSMTSDLTQEKDEDVFEWTSMVKEEDRVDFSSQRPVHERHQVIWDKNLTQLAGATQTLAKKRRAVVQNAKMAEAKLTEAKEEVHKETGLFSKRQLLDMIVPCSQTSKNKGTAAAKKELEVKKSFSHVLKKVKKQEVKQASYFLSLTSVLRIN